MFALRTSFHSVFMGRIIPSNSSWFSPDCLSILLGVSQHICHSVWIFIRSKREKLKGSHIRNHPTNDQFCMLILCPTFSWKASPQDSWTDSRISDTIFRFLCKQAYICLAGWTEFLYYVLLHHFSFFLLKTKQSKTCIILAKYLLSHSYVSMVGVCAYRCMDTFWVLNK